MNEAKETKYCIACGQLISANATLCHHCNSYQNWRRHVAFTQTTLALLVALVAVVGATAPVLYKIYKGNNSDLSGQFVDFRKGRAVFIVRNAGNAPGVVIDGGFRFRVDYENATPATMGFSISLSEDDQTIVEPSGTILVSLRGEGVRLGVLKSVFHEKSSDKCVTYLNIQEFDGTKERLEKESLCIAIINSVLYEYKDYIYAAPD